MPPAVPVFLAKKEPPEASGIGACLEVGFAGEKHKSKIMTKQINRIPSAQSLFWDKPDTLLQFVIHTPPPFLVTLPLFSLVLRQTKLFSMKALITFFCIATLTLACGQEPKPTTDTEGKETYEGDSLVIQSDGDAKIIFAPDALEKVKNLKPKPQQHTMDEEPIVIKGVNMGPSINMVMVGKAELVFKRSCSSCHALGKDQGDLIGLAGLTKERDPSWIMNMTTGAPIELDKDPAKVARLQECPTRQPGTRLNIEKARDFVELMRNVDAGQ